MTLLFSVPIQLALAHQATALVLLTATTLHAARMWRCSPPRKTVGRENKAIAPSGMFPTSLA
jgi:heme A synthase